MTRWRSRTRRACMSSRPQAAERDGGCVRRGARGQLGNCARCRASSRTGNPRRNARLSRTGSSDRRTFGRVRVGGVLLFLLTGQHPDESSGKELDWRDVPPPLRAVCMHARERDPERRYVSAAALASDLAAFADDRPVSAYRENVFERSPGRPPKPGGAPPHPGLPDHAGGVVGVPETIAKGLRPGCTGY